LDVIEVTQNEDLQKFKIRVVLETANRLLGIPANWTNIKWTVEGIHSKQLVQLIHFLVALIRHYRAPIRLPQNVTVNLVVVQVSTTTKQTASLFSKDQLRLFSFCSKTETRRTSVIANSRRTTDRLVR
jgi:hypothetical protein